MALNIQLKKMRESTGKKRGRAKADKKKYPSRR